MKTTPGKKHEIPQTFSKKRMKGLVLYICSLARDPSVLGATKLNKILWYSDAMSYCMFGESITGETYIKRQFGPVPKHIVDVIEELETEKKIAVRREPFYGYPKVEFFALSKQDLSEFSPEEISLIDDIANTIFFNHTASSIFALSHDGIWESAQIGEEIPPYAFMASQLGEITEKDMEWAKKKLSRSLASK